MLPTVASIPDTVFVPRINAERQASGGGTETPPGMPSSLSGGSLWLHAMLWVDVLPGHTYVGDPDSILLDFWDRNDMRGVLPSSGCGRLWSMGFPSTIIEVAFISSLFIIFFIYLLHLPSSM